MLSGYWSCWDLPQTPHPIHTLCAHAEKTPKIWFCCFSSQAEGDGEGAGGYDPSAVVHGPCREGSGCDCEGVIRNQANVNSNGQGGLQKNEVLRLQCPP